MALDLVWSLCHKFRTRRPCKLAKDIRIKAGFIRPVSLKYWNSHQFLQWGCQVTYLSVLTRIDYNFLQDFLGPDV